MFLRKMFSGTWRILVCIWAITSASTLVSVFVPAHAGDSHSQSAISLQHQTNALAQLLSQLDDTDAPTNGELVERMRVLAEERRVTLLALMEADPDAVLRNAIPAKIRERVPGVVKAYIEERRTLTGILRVRYEHWADDSELVYEVLTDTGPVVLRFPAILPRELSGTPIRAEGVLAGDVMAVNFSEYGATILNYEPSGTGGTNSTQSLAETYNTMGEQRTLVLLVNWQDSPAYQPFTLEEAYQLVFGAVNNFIRENSFQQTWITGEARGWYTLPMSQPTNTDCRQSTIAQAAQEAAAADGVNLANFDRYIYVFPDVTCLPSGSGSVGGAPSEAWIETGWFQLKTVAHEFGHNLGLFHSGGMDCDLTPLGNECRISPYRDIMDIMGNQSTGHFNGYKKERLGWLDSASGSVIATTTGGSFTLEGFGVADMLHPKVLKVLQKIDPDTGEPTWFYIEHRQALGYDDFLTSNESVLSGVVFRLATETEAPESVSSLLLDMTPGSDSYDDLQDPALPFGSSYSDPASGVFVSAARGDGGTAIVDVSLGPTSCVTAAPTLSVSPSESQWVEAGTLVTYNVVVRNEDSADCGPTLFDLASLPPLGWSSDFGSNSLLIEPGMEEQAILSVTSPAVAADGGYEIELKVIHNGEASKNVSTAVTYIVSSIANNAPPIAIDDEAATSPGESVSVDVLANDSDPDSDPLFVTAVSSPPSGTVSFTADGTVVYTPSKGTKGGDSFGYTISDGMAESRATVFVSIKKQSGSDKNSGDKGNGKKK